jgi:uroporphyrinogen decarboxylase
MRQAGRFLPQYRRLRERYDFLTLCRTPELATRVTLQPVDALGVDAAVIFSDILVALEPMGLQVTFGANHGPRITPAIRRAADLKALRPTDPVTGLRYVYEAIRQTDAALRRRNIPVIGFAGAPFTLACYAIEGSHKRSFRLARRMMRESPATFRALLDRLTEAVIGHLRLQIEAGAGAVQIFDSWGGLLDPKDYRRFALPPIQRIVRALKPTRTPVILYMNGSGPHLDSMRASGVNALSVDWRLPLSEVRRRVGPRMVLQGNLDPSILRESPSTVIQSTRAMLADHNGPHLIANLGHGVLPDTPVRNVRAFVETVKEFRWRTL